jgi:hypothetical protein
MNTRQLNVKYRAIYGAIKILQGIKLKLGMNEVERLFKNGIISSETEDKSIHFDIDNFLNSLPSTKY